VVAEGVEVVLPLAGGIMGLSKSCCCLDHVFWFRFFMESVLLEASQIGVGLTSREGPCDQIAGAEAHAGCPDSSMLCGVDEKRGWYVSRQVGPDRCRRLTPKWAQHCVPVTLLCLQGWLALRRWRSGTGT
jgi:hypothetical protein